MKKHLVSSALLISLLLPRIRGGQPVSLEDYGNITDPLERGKLYEQAPPEQKKELDRINLHLALVAKFGGEAGFRKQKESCIARARGLGSLEMIFSQYVTFWSGYIGDVMVASDKSGMKPEQQEKEDRKLVAEEDIERKRASAIHSIVYSLAPTPAALALERRAEDLSNKFEKRLTWDGVSPHENRPITTEERKGIDRQMNEIYAELQKLPELSPDQLRKEYDAFTDLQLAQSAGGGPE